MESFSLSGGRQGGSEIDSPWGNDEVKIIQQVERKPEYKAKHFLKISAMD